jgi:hypothetical protein
MAANKVPTLEVVANNMTVVHFPNASILFSYETPVAFRDASGVIRSENIWSATTGKHLNRWCPDSATVVDAISFELMLGEAMEGAMVAS